MAYFVLTFVIAWTGSFVAAGPKFLRGEELLFADSLAMALPMFAAPCLAGVLMTAIIDGIGGVRNLFRRAIKWRAAWRWYAAMLLFPGLILVVLLALTKTVSVEFAPVLMLVGLGAGLIAGFFEETGWTGFAYPRMQLRYGVLGAGLVLGIVHAVWHVLPDYLGASAARGDFWLAHFLAFALFVVALRVLIVWVYANTQSLLLAQLMHASSTGFLLVLVPLSLTPAHATLFYWVYAAMLWIVAAIVVATHGTQLAAGKRAAGKRSDGER